MALKSGGLSQIHETTMDYVLDRAAEPGLLVVASGVAGKVDVAGGTAQEVGASGIHPMGILLNTREEMNFAKEMERTQYDSDDIGTVVTLLRRGELELSGAVENGGVSIETGQPAYLAADGKLGNANLSVDGSENQKVGQFMSALDSKGFVQVRIELK